MDGRRRLLHQGMERRGMERRGIEQPRQILMISGSLRAHSTNTALLLTAQAVAPHGVDNGPLRGDSRAPPLQSGPGSPAAAAAAAAAVADLRAQIRRADAVLFSTPEYAGALPGSFKNVLDWTVGDDQPGSMNGKPVAYINVSPRGAALGARVAPERVGLRRGGHRRAGVRGHSTDPRKPGRGRPHHLGRGAGTGGRRAGGAHRLSAARAGPGRSVTAVPSHPSASGRPRPRPNVPRRWPRR